MIEAESLISLQGQFESVASSFISNFCDCNNNDNQKLKNESQLYKQHSGLQNTVDECQVCTENDREVILTQVMKVPDFRPSDYSKYFSKDRFGNVDLSNERFSQEQYAEIYENLINILNNFKSAVDYFWSPDVTCSSCIDFLLSDLFNTEREAGAMVKVLLFRKLVVPCDFCPEDKQNQFSNLFRINNPSNQAQLRELVIDWEKSNQGCLFCLNDLVKLQAPKRQ
jgi:hypothetical protein